MKKYLFSALALAMAFATLGQGQRTCGTDQHEAYLTTKNPKRAQERARYEQALNEWIAKNPQATQKGQMPIVTIPLVVHLLWQNATENITDAQIQSQIDILNADYTRTNADAASTPSAFQSVSSSPQIQFCWAAVDPSGNPTNGIERRQTTVATFSTNDNMKFFSSGGLDAWDVTKYFNIWVCDLGSSLLGYGEFPTGSPSNTWGFVCNYWCFGDTLTVNAPFDKGRTSTHEIGHCLNLFHIWGDDGSACTGSDQCADTPNQAGENYGCPVFPKTDACQTASPGVMFMNYMDYTDDACMNNFTINQSSRMLAVINNPPYNSLLTSTVCTPTTLQPVDAGIFAVNAPQGGLGCVTTFTPNVTLKNWGTNTLTSATISYKVDNGTPQTFNWNGSLASLATTTVALPAVTATAGTHTFSANTLSPNGTTDGNLTNDASTSNFNVTPPVGTPVPYSQGFEGSSSIPAGWNLYNPDTDAAWEINTTVANLGSNCMGFNNCDGDGSTDMTGRVDRVYTEGFDFSNLSTAQVTFDLATAILNYQGTNYSDRLVVSVSTNCGGNWTQLYNKTGATLATAPTYTSIASCWVPSGASQWRNEAINLNSYVGQSNVMLAFENTSDWATWIYIDNINITGTVGVKTETAAMGLYVYPNPSLDGKFRVDVKKNEGELNGLCVYDVLGNKVFEAGRKPAGIFEMDLSHLGSGTYFIQFNKESKTAFTKIVISK